MRHPFIRTPKPGMDGVPYRFFDTLGVRYLFIGKCGAILLGYPDTTQDADAFVEKSAEEADRRALTVESTLSSEARRLLDGSGTANPRRV